MDAKANIAIDMINVSPLKVEDASPEQVKRTMIKHTEFGTVGISDFNVSFTCLFFLDILCLSFSNLF